MRQFFLSSVPFIRFSILAALVRDFGGKTLELCIFFPPRSSRHPVLFPLVLYLLPYTLGFSFLPCIFLHVAGLKRGEVRWKEDRRGGFSLLLLIRSDFTSI